MSVWEQRTRWTQRQIWYALRIKETPPYAMVLGAVNPDYQEDITERNNRLQTSP